jgi:hypothetical protein
MHDSRKKDGPDKSPVLAQRAVSEDPRWTRAVGDSFRAILEKHQRASLEGLLSKKGARATRGLRKMGRAPWSSSCSRNAHDRNVLVRRAQSRINQGALENEMGIEITRVVGNSFRAILGQR